jgi:peptidoglycan/xylan/chitin deacetylase (PgdA/CDA1 family)
MKRNLLWKTSIKQLQVLVLLCLCFGQIAHSQNVVNQLTRKQVENKNILEMLYKDSAYVQKKRLVNILFAHTTPGQWGEFVKGVDEELVTQKKIIAFTFDACGNKSNKYNNELIDYLRKEKIPATLFVSGAWIDDNYNTFLELSKDTLFEIENHGLNHQPCSVNGESEYGIKGTPNVPDAFDEIEANERKIELLTGRRPLFYRSATAFTDEACARIAKLLNITIVSFDILSGDAMPFVPAQSIVNNVIKNAKPGAIVIMHFNHPEWFLCDAMMEIIPSFRKKGYAFTRLKDYPLKSR